MTVPTQPKQIKSKWYYIFWAIATLAVVLGQIYVATSYRALAHILELSLTWIKEKENLLNEIDNIEESQNKTDLSAIVGKNLANIAKKKKITKVVFDRNGYPFHGRVKAFADAAREAGLEF